MKKFIITFAVFITVLNFSCSAFAVDNDYVGFLTRLKTTPEEFFMLMKQSWSTNGWIILGGDHSTSKARFYDSLMIMQMALNRGEIEEMILPEFVSEYLLKISKSYSPCCISNSGPMNLCFGFLKDNAKLRDKWNMALNSMINDFTLAGLEQKYIKNFPENNHSYDYIYGTKPEIDKKKHTIKFEHFRGSPFVRVAVTGDLPPVDFIAEDGMPAGYSTAVLAEIGRRLRINIELISVSAAARTAALATGRADVVFWYEVNMNKSLASQPDVDEGIILSVPYLYWDKFIHVRLDN